MLFRLIETSNQRIMNLYKGTDFRRISRELYILPDSTNGIRLSRVVTEEIKDDRICVQTLNNSYVFLCICEEVLPRFYVPGGNKPFNYSLKSMISANKGGTVYGAE